MNPPKTLLQKCCFRNPQHGHSNRDRQRPTYIDTIKADTGLDNTKETTEAMHDHVVWKGFITAGDNSQPN